MNENMNEVTLDEVYGNGNELIDVVKNAAADGFGFGLGALAATGLAYGVGIGFKTLVKSVKKAKKSKDVELVEVVNKKK